ncbi:hypothetical protein D9756_003480 [Leucocoprinus leucothites]|uniref:F-box domain-containing protein n=1 Tax=Leucocoprinus leucothites TaxID=201217 RepID=A0A8H5LJ05_9AGAR|nr:hypothetical protein D9756_003480 [Leucoagaricus leucothites]
MESPEEGYGSVFDLVRNLGPPPIETRGTLSTNLTIAETRLASLQRKHDELVKEMKRYHFTINAINSLHSPWRRLPIELLAEIFSYCQPDDITQGPSVRSVPLTLTQVCSSWYRIATDIPHLWSSIVLTSDLPYLPERLAHGTEYLRACALRSKNGHIELHLSIHFIAYRPSYELIKQHAHQITAITFHYPPMPMAPVEDQPSDGPCAWFIHSDPLTLPNLCSLEIQDPNTTDNLSESDFSQLRLIADSAQHLRRYMFYNRLVQPDGPILTNWSSVTELTLIDPTPVALLSHILRNAPMLRMMSFNCLYESLAPAINPPMQMMLSNPELTIPFTHDHLQTMLIGYGDSITLVSLFNLTTLPNLQHVLFEKWNEDPNAWAQEAFVSFLTRSRCPLKALDLYFTPVTTGELVEILEVPTVRAALRELMIQNGHSEVEKIIDDDFCELLTLSTPLAGRSGGTVRAVCPNLEVIGFHSCHSCSKPALVRMLRSRLDPNFQYHQSSSSPSSVDTPQGPTYLKYFETDIPPDVAQQFFKPLLQDGLVTLLYDSNTNILPATEEEKRLLKRFTSEGLELWEYDPVRGAWGPTDFWMRI